MTVPLIVVCSVIALVSAFSYAVARVFFAKSVMRDKTPAETERIWYENAEKRGNKDIADKFRAGKEYIASCKSRELCIKSRDGLKLFARYYDAKSKTTVVMVHGFHSFGAHDFAVPFRFVREKLSCNILLIDQRAHANSEGKWLTYGVREQDDVTDWCRLVSETLCPGGKIYLYGISMGCASCLLAASTEKMPDSLCGIIADCGYTSMMDEIRFLLTKRYRLPSMLAEPFLWNLCVKKAGFDPLAADVNSQMFRIKVPVLFFHGTADRLIPISQSERNFDACRTEKKLVRVENAPHGLAFVYNEELCEKEISEFIKR